MQWQPSRLRKTAIFLWMAALSFLAFSQAKSKPKPKSKTSVNTKAKSYSLIKIKFSGLQQLDAEQAILAAGLRKGQKVFFTDIDSASHRLAESGFFSSVAYQSIEKRTGLELEFQVEESRNFLPCIFDNFVWFRNDELMKAVRDRLPLFKGSLPLSGNAKQELTAALQDLMRARQIPGTVRFRLNADLVDNARMSTCLILIADVSLPITSVHFRGANAIAETELQNKTKMLIGQQYSLKSVKELIDRELVPIFKKKGYFRVQFRDPAVEIQTVSSMEYKINLILNVAENAAYRWEKPSWIGDLPVPADVLNQILGMNPGDIAEQARIDKGFFEIRKELSRRGYMDADLKATPELNDAAASVRYSVQLIAGSQYRMGSLNFSGAPENIVKKLRSKWKIASSEIFDGIYPAEFLADVKDILESKRLAAAYFNAAPDRARQIVNVTYEFRPSLK
jgi:outer membrane protein assembly factor BamA